jgi:transcriptional regulator with XRE-family HTH domain
MGRARQKRLTARQVLADNLRRLRRIEGLSQETLADRAALHRTYVGSVERAERNVSIDNIEKLASALRVDPHLLLTPPPAAGRQG